EIDPLTANNQALRAVACRPGLSHIADIADNEESRDTLLQLLFVSGIEPRIGHDKPVFFYHYPASQSALARINPD
ncbi:MAG: elongation factor P lysine(34) lysyltransferase, partial [Candidatus Regiella insecticola]|nr:elongation factor P lysine(34) lysyltransferase [Candidatus Regiella insecticola]